MSFPVVEVTAPSRLHFGMLSFGQPHTRQFGGIGAMVSQPELQLRISPAERFEIIGPLGHRVDAVVDRYRRRQHAPSPPACRREITNAPNEHVGLGTGTQLAV